MAAKKKEKPSRRFYRGKTVAKRAEEWDQHERDCFVRDVASAILINWPLGHQSTKEAVTKAESLLDELRARGWFGSMLPPRVGIIRNPSLSARHSRGDEPANADEP